MCSVSNNIQIKPQNGENCNLGDFDHGRVVGGRQAGVSIS